ncbi:MAG: hypothetical protein ACXWJK_14415 [Burkholderiaceae bacterium]
MSEPIRSTEQSDTKDQLSKKLWEFYSLNKSYIDAAEKYLAKPSGVESTDTRCENLTRNDIDRLYSHISALEHIAKLLYEEFLSKK